MNLIYKHIKELAKEHTFSHKRFLSKNGKVHSKGLKTSHELFDLDKKVIKEITEDKPEFISLDSGFGPVLLQRSNSTPDVLTSSGTKHTSKSVHYTGVIEDDEDSSVSISFSHNKVIGLVVTKGTNYNLGQLEDSEDYIFAQEEDLTSGNPNTCSDTSTSISPLIEPQALLESTKVLQLYWEVRNQIFISKGSLDSTVFFIQSIFNQVQTIYLNAGFYISLKTLKVWDTPDPYTGTNSNTLLQEFGVKSPYITTQTGNKRGLGDVAQLIGYNLGGIAWTGTLNSTNPSARMAYSGIHSDYQGVPVYSWSVDVLGHELFHLYGSPHTHEYSWYDPVTGLYNQQIDGCGTGCTKLPANGAKGTIMSYCHLCSNGKSLIFDPQGIQLCKYYLSVATNVTGTTEVPVIITPPPVVPPSPSICPNPLVITCSITQRLNDVIVNRTGYTNYKYSWKKNGIQQTWTGQTVNKLNYKVVDKLECTVTSTNAQTSTKCYIPGTCSYIIK